MKVTKITSLSNEPQDVVAAKFALGKPIVLTFTNCDCPFKRGERYLTEFGYALVAKIVEGSNGWEHPLLPSLSPAEKETILASDRFATVFLKKCISQNVDFKGNQVPDWRGRDVFQIASNTGTKEDSRYGENVSLFRTAEQAASYGAPVRKATLSRDVKILNLGCADDWNLFVALTVGKDGQQIKAKDIGRTLIASGYDGVYDTEAGQLFVFNSSRVEFHDSC